MPKGEKNEKADPRRQDGICSFHTKSHEAPHGGRDPKVRPGDINGWQQAGIHGQEGPEYEHERQDGDVKCQAGHDKGAAQGAQDKGTRDMWGLGVSCPVEQLVVAALIAFANPPFRLGPQPRKWHAGKQDPHDLGRMVHAEIGRQGECGKCGSRQMRRYECPCGNEIKPEKFKEYGNVQAGCVITREGSPE